MVAKRRTLQTDDDIAMQIAVACGLTKNEALNHLQVIKEAIVDVLREGRQVVLPTLMKLNVTPTKVVGAGNKVTGQYFDSFFETLNKRGS